MGNVLGINCSVILPWDHLIPWCFPREDAPRSKTINDLQNDLERLKAIRDDIKRTFRESLNMTPLEQETQWLHQVETLEGKVETLIADYYRLYPRTDNTEEAANNSADIVESSERRPPEQVIQNQQAANTSVDIVESSEMRPPEQVIWNQQAADNSVPIVESSERRPPEHVIQNSKCFCGYSPKCIKSYNLWIKVQLMDRNVLDLLNQKPVLTIERPRIAPAPLVPTEPTTGMQSMLDKVWSHVENQQDNVIGLYGMGGVGKTTLLKSVNNKLCSSSLNYDLLLWIVVSKSPNLINIQNHIGEKIGFHGDAWKLKSQDDKAMDIYNVLNGKKYILLLDDIWERFDLTNVGIPLPDLANKSKLIFTTRSLQVCGLMRATTEIQVQCLDDEEAWNLFKENVGEKALNGDHLDIHGLAKDVMRECKGLPLALTVIGRAMASKTTVQDWEHAILVLKYSTMTDNVFSHLMLSYDNLADYAIRSCFLYFSLYPEDEEISKNDLVDKWICEDYLGRSGDLLLDRMKGHHYINTLVHASLLEECPGGEKVKMHDVIRDMALWIGGDAGFYVQARAGLNQVPNDVKWEHVEKLSLMDNHIGELNNGPTEFTKIETILFLRAELKSINNDFWKFVPYLKVLDLSYNRDFTSLPDEFCTLVSLQYLNLEGTNIEKIPSGFKRLVKLKYLNVINTQVETIPEGVLLSMKKLFVFRCYHYGSHDFLSANMVKEFEGLKYLMDVTISAHSQVNVSNLTSSRKLSNYVTALQVNGGYANKWTNLGLDILFLKEMGYIRILHLEQVTRIKKIEVWERQELKTSIMNNRNDGFNNIRSLVLTNCHEVKNLSWLVFFPNIESIKVINCDQMETLIGDKNEYKLDNGREPFAKLQSLHLAGLPNLESICVTSWSFPCLNSLYVDADKLKKLPFHSNSCDRGRGIAIEGATTWWNELQWENEATRVAFSSRFIVSSDPPTLRVSRKYYSPRSDYVNYF